MKFKEEDRTEWGSCYSKTLRENAHRKNYKAVLNGWLHLINNFVVVFLHQCFVVVYPHQCFVLITHAECRSILQHPLLKDQSPPPPLPVVVLPRPYPRRSPYQAAYHDHSFVTPEKEVSGLMASLFFRFFFLFADRFLWQRAERWSGVAWGYCLGEEWVGGGPWEGPSALPPPPPCLPPPVFSCVCVCVRQRERERSFFCSCVFVLYLLELVSVGLGLACGR